MVKSKQYIVATFQIRGTFIVLQRIAVVDAGFDHCVIAEAMAKYAADTDELLAYVDITYVQPDTIEHMTGLVPVIGLDKYLK